MMMIEYANYQKICFQSAPDDDAEIVAISDWVEMMVDVVQTTAQKQSMDRSRSTD